MTMHTYEARTTSDDLLNLVPVDSPNEGQPTPEQSDLIARLIGQVRELDEATAQQAEAYTVRMIGKWTPGRDGNASRWIDRLISKVRELRAARAVGLELEDGMYVLDGEIYKVQHAVHGSGRQYAKLLIPNETKGQKATFEYAPGVVTKLRPEHRMTKDQAKEYGALYGTCVRCGRVLTAEDSIDRMMGLICSGKI